MKKFLVLFILFIFLFSVGFMYIEKTSFLNALYYTIVTLWTVGYGDVVPLTDAGRIFTIFMIVIGTSLGLYFITTVFTKILDPEFIERRKKKRMLSSIANLKNHIIVCGAGRVGRQVVEELCEDKKTSFVVIEIDEEALKQLRDKIKEEYDRDLLYVIGDATYEEVLMQAGIQNAMGIILTLPDDTDNVYVTLTAKGLNKDIEVVSRCERYESIKKLLQAGASKVVTPAILIGQRMVADILKPTTVSVLETLSTRKGTIQIEEFIAKSSKIVGRNLKELSLNENYNIMVIALKRGDDIVFAPKSDEKILYGDIIIIMGRKDSLDKFEKEFLNE